MITWIVLAVVLLAGVACLFSAHIPGLRDLTGAAPLQPEEPDTARDFARTVRDGHLESVEEWAARTQPKRRQP